MGIYPTVKISGESRLPGNGGEIWTEEINRHDGVLRYRRVYAGPWVEGERTACFCCSCDDSMSVVDPACRNHGWAALRPCELHGMPGKPWAVIEETDQPDVMPISVQAKRAGGIG